MNKKLLFIAAALFLGGLVGGRYIAGQLAQTPDPLLGEGEAAQTDSRTAERRPDFRLADLEGEMRHVKEWDGKVLVVNFWATWCAPCRKEIPFFNTLQARYGDKGLQFIGIAVDDARAVKRFMEIIPIDYPVLVGDDDAIPIAKAYGNREGILPFTVFVRRDGTIASIAKGGLTEDITEQTLLKLL